ncbi:MAG: hypothetical protein Q9198_008029 [Flavoplaca austrocitrina]
METSPNTGLQSLPNIVQQLPKVNESNEKQIHENLVAVEAYLSNAILDVPIPDNLVAANQVQDWTINATSPTEAFAQEAPYAAGMVMFLYVSAGGLLRTSKNRSPCFLHRTLSNAARTKSLVYASCPICRTFIYPASTAR